MSSVRDLAKTDNVNRERGITKPSIPTDTFLTISRSDNKRQGLKVS